MVTNKWKSDPRGRALRRRETEQGTLKITRGQHLQCQREEGQSTNKMLPNGMSMKVDNQIALHLFHAFSNIILVQFVEDLFLMHSLIL